MLALIFKSFSLREYFGALLMLVETPRPLHFGPLSLCFRSLFLCLLRCIFIPMKFVVLHKFFKSFVAYKDFLTKYALRALLG